MLSHYGNKIRLMLDGDEAGRKATKKIVENWDQTFDIDVIDIPEGLDPAQLTRKQLEELL